MSGLWIFEYIANFLPSAVAAKFAATAEGKVDQTEHYNLSMIISVGFRVKAKRGVEFRRWASHFHVIYPHNDSSQK